MFDSVIFEVYSGLYQDFFNFLVESGYYIKNVKSTVLGFTAKCSASDYLVFAKEAKKYQCKIKISEKTGLLFRIKKLKNRKGIVYGVILAILLMSIFNNFLWKININIDNPTIKNNTANILFENGIYTGTIYQGKKLKDIEKKLIEQDENIGFVTLNFYKGTLNCEIYPREKKEGYMDNSTNGDILAKESGVIKELRVYDGYSELMLEQSVSKGDILVMALNPITLKYTPTRAYIAAVCNRDYAVTIPFFKTVNVYTGRTTKKKNIYVMNSKIEIGKKAVRQYDDYTENKMIEYYNFCGFALPVTVETILCAETKKQNIELDFLSAQSMAISQIEHQIMTDDKLVEEYGREYIYEADDNCIKTICRVSCMYDIT